MLREEPQVWENRMADFRASGLSLVAWCAANDVRYNQMRYRVDKQKALARKPGSFNAPAWIKVSDDQRSCEPMLLVKVGGATIEVKKGFDASLLRSVVECLDGC